MQYIYCYNGYIYFVLPEYISYLNVTSESKFRLKVKYSSIVIVDITLCTVVQRNLSQVVLFYFFEIE